MSTTPASTDLDFDPACNCRRCGKCDRALGELAAAREELAKTRAELDARNVLHTSLAHCRAVEQDYTSLIRKCEAMESVVVGIAGVRSHAEMESEADRG